MVSKMIVKSMSIENFRPYKGPVSIEFARGEKNVTIIQGRNDAGKTSFINAFTWCLYDKEPFRDEGIEGRCNQLALDKVNIKEDKVFKKFELIDQRYKVDSLENQKMKNNVENIIPKINQFNIQIEKIETRFQSIPDSILFIKSGVVVSFFSLSIFNSSVDSVLFSYSLLSYGIV